MENSNTKLMDQFPILHVRGTHSEIGFAIGRQFRSMIEELTSNWRFLNDVLIPTYKNTEIGRQIYDATLDLCRRKFRNYVEELEGMAEGSKVPFFKLFLMHLESVMVPPGTESSFLENKEISGLGCTSIICNKENVLLGHTEDTSKDFANNVYIVSAEILSKDGKVLEKFSTLTYAGHLPGYTMGFNTHGMIYSINTLYPVELNSVVAKTPRTFLTRAILGCKNLSETLEILRDSGTGSSDGFSLNIGFVDKDGNSSWNNVEAAPPFVTGEVESQLDILEIPGGQSYSHCNRYRRLLVPQSGNPEFNSSCQRLKAIEKHGDPCDIESFKGILSDQSDEMYPIFRNAKLPDLSLTVVCGIFDLGNRQWLIYSKPPSESEPIVAIPLTFLY